MSLVSIRKKGPLYKLPVKGFVKKWNRRWFVLHCTTIEGIVRLEYFDSETYEATAMGKRTIPLRQCKDISPTSGTKTHPYVFQFTTPMGHHVFAADTHTDMEEWMSSMQEAIMEDRQRNRRKKAQSMIIQQDPGRNMPPSLSRAQTQVAIQQPPPQNDTYEPNNSGTYRVTLEVNETIKRLKLTGLIYNLDITPDKITLIAADSGAEVAQWQYRQIRTYGKSSGKFNFECGKTAETGQGVFVFKTTCSKEIFGVVHRNIKRIRTQDTERLAERQNVRGVVRMPKQASLTEQIPRPPFTETADFRTHQHWKTKPTPNKPKSMNVGTYRLSREFGNPPSYEEVAAVDPVKEESEEQPTYQPMRKAVTVPELTEKSKKQNTQGESRGSRHSTAQSPGNPFSSPNQQDQQENISENPFLVDPFLFSPQPGANSFEMAPGTDPFVIPPLPADIPNQGATAELGHTVFDDLEQFDSPGCNVFNFDVPIQPPTNGSSTAPNTVGDVNNPNGNNFDLDLLDDRLFDTLAQLDVQDSAEKKENLAAKGQPSTKNKFGFSSPHTHPPSFVPSTGATASGSHRTKTKPLSQQDFDNLWDGIYATMPSPDS